MKTFIQFLEARFQAEYSQLKDIDANNLEKLVRDLATNAFGPEKVIANGWGGTKIVIDNRYFKINVDGVAHLPGMSIPKLYISYDWDYDARPSGLSSKWDTDSYRVRIQIGQETVLAMHKIRDDIIRPLSEYKVLINYVPIGDRRTSFYSKVLRSSGFAPLEDYDSWWTPTILKQEIERAKEQTFASNEA